MNIFKTFRRFTKRVRGFFTPLPSPFKRGDEIGYIGLGKMGSNMSLRLKECGYEVMAYDPDLSARQKVEHRGVKTAASLKELTQHLTHPCTVWIMVPHHVVDDVLCELTALLKKGDTLIEGGNSPYTQSKERAEELKKKGIHFIDAGVSGGPKGARYGACTMVGGEKKVVDAYTALFKDISVEGGFLYTGSSGSGHFVKMVHNGIEYGMMQALAEGFDIMKHSEFDLNLAEISRVYNHGSVIQSSLLEWLEKAYTAHGDNLEKITGKASYSGEAGWTVEAAHEHGIPDEVIHDALTARKISHEVPSYQGKVISALRGQFGGHSVEKDEDEE